MAWIFWTILILISLEVQIVYGQDPSATTFQGRGHVGSVVDAMGCVITYELSCTDTSLCTDVIVRWSYIS